MAEELLSKNELLTLTGNFFVDNGLAVITPLAECDSIYKLTLDMVRNVHGDGTRPPRNNNRLVSTKSLYLNSMLTNNNRRKKPVAMIENYAKITTAILDSIGKETINKYCDFCITP
jgi:hypothetical protein